MVSSEAKNGFNCVSCGTFHRDEASCGVVRQNENDPAKRFPFGTIVEGFCQVRVSQYIRRKPNLAPGHSAHSMASEFFTEDFLAGASSGMRTSADASVHAHGPSLITTHASMIDLVLSMEKVSGVRR